MKFARVGVFCALSSGDFPEYEEAAHELGAKLAARGITLVYGARNIGLMGCVADAVRRNGGAVIGIIPEDQEAPENHRALFSEYHEVGSVTEQKQRMLDLCDAFVALPGGFGTFDELFEVANAIQLELLHKPLVLLNVRGFFDPLMKFLQFARSEGFLHPEYGRILQIAPNPDALIRMLIDAEPFVDRNGGSGGVGDRASHQ